MSIIGSNALAGASGQAGAAAAGFKIDRSIRLNDGDSAYFSRTPSNAGNRKTFTWSSWVKKASFSGDQQLFYAAPSSSDTSHIRFTGTALHVFEYTSGFVWQIKTTRAFRDPSAWYHIVVAVDTTQSTASDRVKIYVNGVQETDFSSSSYPSQNADTEFNNNIAHTIGRNNQGSNNYFDGYLAEVYWVDGQALAASDFGEYDSNSVWQPKEFAGTYGPLVNQSQDWSSGTYSGTTPGSGYEVAKAFNNVGFPGDSFGTGKLWGFYPGSATLTLPAAITLTASSTVELYTWHNTGSSGNITFTCSNGSVAVTPVDNANIASTVVSNPYTTFGASITAITVNSSGSDWTALAGIVIDGKLLVDSDVTVADNSFYLKFDDNSSNAALGTDSSGNSNTFTVNNLTAKSPGDYDAPQNFGVVTYTGNGSTQSISSLNFQPDFVWIKQRNTARDHVVFDSIRGANKIIYPNATAGDASYTNTLNSFDSNGFTLGGNQLTNENNGTYVAWCWKGGGTAVSNTNGTITSSVSANPDYGFSVVKWTSDGTDANKTVGHGLLSAPKLVIIKSRDESRHWLIWHTALDNDEAFLFTNGQPAGSRFGPNAPTSSVFGVHGGQGNRSTTGFIGYCFADVTGYQKIGTVTGSGSDQTITTGFCPQYVFFKAKNADEAWLCIDRTRDPSKSSAATKFLEFNNTNAEVSNVGRIKWLADGFKIVADGTRIPNVSGTEYIYLAIAGVPSGEEDDSLIDTPTNYSVESGNAGGNYATLNPLDSSSNYTLSNGNLVYTHSTSGQQMTSSTIAVNSGKWYVECTPTALGGTYTQIGISPVNTSNTTYTGDNGYSYAHNGSKYGLASGSSYASSYAANDVIGIAFDADGGNLYFYKNGVAQNSGTAAFTSIDTSKQWRFSISNFNSGTGFVNFGQRPFAYTPPTGYVSLCTQNLPDPTIADGSTAFDIALWTGNGSSAQTISTPNLSPDMVWYKERSSTSSHAIVDSVRGATNAAKVIYPDRTDAEATANSTQSITSLNSDGFTIGSSDNSINQSSQTYVGWAWGGGDLATGTYSSYDQSQHWSANTSGAVFGGVIGDLFDTATSTGIYPGTTGTAGTFDVTLTFSPGIACTSLRVYTKDKQTYATGSVSVNGGTHESVPGTDSWTTLTAPSTLNSLVLRRVASSASNNAFRFTAIEVNGKILIDPGIIPVGGLNSSVYDQSQTWSNGTVTINNTGGTPGAYSNGTYNFDNDITNWGSFVPNYTGTITWTYTFPTALTGVTSIRVYAYNGDSGGTTNSSYGVNSSSYQAGQGTTGTASWQDLTSLLTGTTVTQITGTFGVPSAETSPRGLFQAIEINGKRLLDPSVTPTNVPSIASTCRANQTAGLSIISFVGNGSTNQTVAHNLNAKPSLVIYKDRDTTTNWRVIPTFINDGHYLALDNTDAIVTGSASYFGTNTSSVLGISGSNSGIINASGNNILALAFSPVEGFSAFGSYTGNGSADGPFVHTGMRPKFVLLRNTSRAEHWMIYDALRSDFNAYLAPNISDAEGSFTQPVFGLSNGFQLGDTRQLHNRSGDTYIYAAFAEHPFSLNGGLAR